MQKTRKGLGRGLSALIPDADMEFLTRVARGEDIVSTIPKSPRSHRPKSKASLPTIDSLNNKVKSGAAFQENTLSSEVELKPLAELIPVSHIEANPYQPRRTFSEEEMQELSDSVKQHGVLQPVLLRPLPVNEDTEQGSSNKIKYQLVAGERRWRASQKAGLKEIPGIIRQVTDQQALELAVIENVQRHDISALDAAVAYRRLSQEFSLSQEQIAQRVGKSRVSISNTIRLLDLPIEVQKAITDGNLTEGHGRAILLADTDGARRAVFRSVLRQKLSVRATEELARANPRSNDDIADQSLSENLPETAQNSEQSLPEIRRIEEGLQKCLGTRVRIRTRKRGGQLIIQYFSNEELERLVKVMIR